MPSSGCCEARSDQFRSVHPGAIVDAIRPMREVVDRHFAPWRFAAWLFSLLGAVAVTVAVIGLYALLAHQVAHRTREIGLRIALGARNRHIVASGTDWRWRKSRSPPRS